MLDLSLTFFFFLKNRKSHILTYRNLTPNTVSHLSVTRCHQKNKQHTEHQVKVSSLCPNVLLLLHSLFNEYSERQINTDRTAAKRRKRRWLSVEKSRDGGGAAGVEQEYS